MSYDIDLDSEPCPACGRGDDGGPELPNPTYNLTPIFDRALTGEPLPNPDVGEGSVVLFGTKTDRPRGLRLLSGKLAAETVPVLEAAVAALENPDLAATFTALEPPNRWGTLPDAQRVMRKLLEAAREYPKLRWRIR